MKDMLLFVLAGFATAAFAVGHIVWKKRSRKARRLAVPVTVQSVPKSAAIPWRIHEEVILWGSSET